MKVIFNLCGLVTIFYLLACIAIFLEIVCKIFKKQPITNELKKFNPYNIFKLFQNNDGGYEQKTKPTFAAHVFSAVVLTGLIYLTIPYTPFGFETIGSPFEKREYKTYYYVNMFPENSDSKNYKVIAQICASDKNYIIQKAFFTNGEYLTFNNYIFGLPGDSLKFDKKVYIEDDKGEKWQIQLIDEQPVRQKIEALKR